MALGGCTMKINKVSGAASIILMFAIGLTSETHGQQSNLDGLFRTLKWEEFKGPVPPKTPYAAETVTSFSSSPPTFHRTTNGKFQLDDRVTIKIKFDPLKSWVNPEVKTWPSGVQQNLLDHEQWHYNITALVARDLFITLMSLKEGEYDSAADGRKSYDFYVQTYRQIEQDLQRKYDSETMHSQMNTFISSSGLLNQPSPKGSTQDKWERIMQQAFTAERVPQIIAPDGAPYKVELVDILRQNQLYP